MDTHKINDIISQIYNCNIMMKNINNTLDNVRSIQYNALQAFIATNTSIIDADKLLIFSFLSAKLQFNSFSISFDKEQNTRQRYFLEMLRPYDVTGYQKVRVGTKKDGGYVMIDPKLNVEKIAYSFGISHFSPWDLEMASYGFKVYQYDGTISQAPDAHPNLFFTSKNIGTVTNKENNTISVEHIFHLTEPEAKNAILQVDIENAEWVIFEKIQDAILKKFKQIIIEFHGINVMDTENFNYKCSIINKLLQYYIPIHVHCNNYGKITYNNGIFFCDTFEVSFFRKDDEEYVYSSYELPCHLDSPNCPHYPDIPIRFNIFS